MLHHPARVFSFLVEPRKSFFSHLIVFVPPVPRRADRTTFDVQFPFPLFSRPVLLARHALPWLQPGSRAWPTLFPVGILLSHVDRIFRRPIRRSRHLCFPVMMNVACRFLKYEAHLRSKMPRSLFSWQDFKGRIAPPLPRIIFSLVK